MSYKDQRYYRVCPICSDILPGTDDGAEVFEGLVSQLAEIDAGANYVPNCGLCGEDCASVEAARKIVKAGEPEMKKA